MSITFAIPTVVHYIEKTIPIVVNSLLKNNVQLEQIHVFINSSDRNEDEVLDGITYHHHTGLSCFEWVTPKVILERNLRSDWWFLLHDTVEFGNNFESLFNKFMVQNDKKIVKLTPVHSNSIGVLHQDVFDNHREFFFNKLNDLNLIEDIIERKRWCIQNENQYLHLEPFAYFQPDDAYQSQILGNHYDVQRVEEYFHGIDLMKYKKNNYGYAAVRDVNL